MKCRERSKPVGRGLRPRRNAKPTNLRCKIVADRPECDPYQTVSCHNISSPHLYHSPGEMESNISNLRFSISPPLADGVRGAAKAAGRRIRRSVLRHLGHWTAHWLCPSQRTSRTFGVRLDLDHGFCGKEGLKRLHLACQKRADHRFLQLAACFFQR